MLLTEAFKLYVQTKGINCAIIYLHLSQFYTMNEQLKSDLLKNEADEFWANCESKAAELEVTVDYYLEEFYI